MTQMESNLGRILFELVIDLEFPKQINLDYLFSSEGFVSPRMEWPLAGIDFHIIGLLLRRSAAVAAFAFFLTFGFVPPMEPGLTDPVS